MKAEKQFLLDEVQETVESESFVVTQYENLNSDLAQQFRKKLISSGARFYVVKKRLLVKAGEKVGVSFDLKQLAGHIGVMVPGQDPLAAIKSIVNFADDNKNTLTLVQGQFEGKTCSVQEIETLAKLPDLDGMRARLLALLQAPMSQTLSVMQALLCSIMYLIENKIKKES